MVSLMLIFDLRSSGGITRRPVYTKKLRVGQHQCAVFAFFILFRPACGVFSFSRFHAMLPGVTGALTLATCGLDLMRIACDRCGRRGLYRRATLVERFGANAALPDVLRAVAECDRARDMSRPCGANYVDLAPTREPRR
jgi:hypothetical protein